MPVSTGRRPPRLTLTLNTKPDPVKNPFMNVVIIKTMLKMLKMDVIIYYQLMKIINIEMLLVVSMKLILIKK